MESIDNKYNVENHKDDTITTTEKGDTIPDHDYSKLQPKTNKSSIIVDCVDTKYGDTDDDMIEGSVCSITEQIVSEENEVSKVLNFLGNTSLPRIWPQTVNLYQPLENEQLLFSEMPNCLFVKAYLRVCNVKYDLIQKANAENIGPSGEVPVLRFGKYVVSGTEQIIEFLEGKGILLTSSIDEAMKAEMNSYMSFVRMTLGNAEDFITWLDPETFSKVTWSRFCSVYPWPLGSYLIRKKQQSVQNKLRAMDWDSKTFDDICEEIEMCFKSLSDKLEDNFFFGNQATALDLLVFAHTYTIIKTDLPRSHFVGIVLQYPKLVKHCYRILEALFQELNTSNQFADLVNNLSQ